MRPTITLDDDVAALIESERARTGELFPAAVNRLLRRSARAAPPLVPPALPELPGVRSSTYPTRRRCSRRSTTSGVRSLASRDACRHEPARLRDLCWPVVYAFLRLITSARVFAQHAVTVSEGWAVAAAYLKQPAVRLVAAGTGHMAI